MKMKSIALLCVAMACGLVAMLGVQQVLSGGNGPSKAEQQMTKVYMAATEIPAGVFIDQSMVKAEKWPKANVPAGAVTDAQQFAERALLVKVYPGDLILKAKLGEKGKSGASVAIPVGMRVVTVPVNLTIAHSGLIQPGDRVDVLVTYKAADPVRGSISKTKSVLEFIEVFATDRLRDVSESGGEEGKSTVKNISLLVTPQQGALLMLAASKGTLQLALRHSDDAEQGKSIAVDEAYFDGAPVSQSERPVEDEEFALAEPVPEERPATSLKEFLDQQETPAAAPQPAEPAAPAAPAEVVVEEPKRPTWSIIIYEQDTKRVEEIELPFPEELPTANDPAPTKTPAA